MSADPDRIGEGPSVRVAETLETYEASCNLCGTRTFYMIEITTRSKRVSPRPVLKLCYPCGGDLAGAIEKLKFKIATS